MSNKKKGQLDKFIEFLHDSALGSHYSPPEGLKRFDDGLAALLKQAQSAQAHSWISSEKERERLVTENARLRKALERIEETEHEPEFGRNCNCPRVIAWCALEGKE